MKASLLKIIRHKGGESRRSRINHKVVTFLVCVAISVFLWTMNTLSGKYTDTIMLSIRYKNMPQSKKMLPVTTFLSVKVVSTGYNLAAYTLGIKDPFLKVNANRFYRENNRYVYTFDNKEHFNKIADQLGTDMKVVEIAPDTLYLETR